MIHCIQAYICFCLRATLVTLILILMNPSSGYSGIYTYMWICAYVYIYVAAWQGRPHSSAAAQSDPSHPLRPRPRRALAGRAQLRYHLRRPWANHSPIPQEEPQGRGGRGTGGGEESAGETWWDQSGAGEKKAGIWIGIGANSSRTKVFFNFFCVFFLILYIIYYNYTIKSVLLY